MTKTIDELTNVGGGFQRYDLDTLTLHGEEGGFSLTRNTQPRGADGKVVKEKIKAPLEFVLLRMRYRLSRYVENGDSYNSTEYDKKTENIVLFQGKMSWKGTAAELKETHRLTTVTVVYCWVPALQQVVKLNIKGLSYGGAEYYPKDKLGWFDFLKKFQDNKLKVHEHLLRADEITVQKKANTFYYALSFSKVRKMTDDEVVEVEARILEVAEKIDSMKSSTQSRDASKDKGSVTGLSIDDKPNDEINPDDIPF
jgi:hypothetical protein